jgi:hypothetical protein
VTANREARKLLDWAVANGWRIRRCGSGHVQAMSPDGLAIVTVSATASDGRALRNAEADMYRAGLPRMGGPKTP